jgi:NitT/TauT family transport system permease protein
MRIAGRRERSLAREWREAIKKSVIPFRVAGYVLFLGAWQLASGRLIAARKLPAPSTIVREIWRLTTSGSLVHHFTPTLTRIVVAMAVVYLVGGVVGLLMGSSRWWESFFRDFVSLLTGIPGLVFVLIFLIIFGVSWTGALIAIVVVNFPFVAIQIWEGIRSIPMDLVDMAQAYDVPRKRVIRRVILPALAPFLFTSLTFSFALTWKLAMLTELFGANRGVGFMMRTSFMRFAIDSLLAWVLAFFVLALAIDQFIFKPMAKRFFRWRVGSFGA